MESPSSLSLPEQQQLVKLPMVERDPARVYLARLGHNTRVDMATRLTRIALMLGCLDPRRMPRAEIRYEHVVAIRTRLKEMNLAASTINSHLSALRGVAHEAWNLRLMSAENYYRIKDVKSVRAARLLRGRALVREEVAALFGICARDSRPHGRRDAALFAVLVGAGLRRSECSALDAGDYQAETSSLRVRNGKGNKERIVYLTKGADKVLAAWLSVRDHAPGPLFVQIGNSTRLQPVRLSASGIYAALRRRAPEAKVRDFSPHDLRRTYISDLLDAGADLATVQRLVGHASPATTERYDRRGDRAKQKAAALVSLPCEDHSSGSSDQQSLRSKTDEEHYTL